MAESKTPAPKLKNEAEIDTSLVRSLADILNDTDLTEIEVERGDLRCAWRGPPRPPSMSCTPPRRP